jgi:argininosuccinate lyase
MTLAKTEAAGGPGLLPEILRFSSSLRLDVQLLREDIVGSLAHVTMLAKAGIIPKPEATAIRDGLVAVWRRHHDGSLQLPDEEDVHMAVEVELNRTIGAPAALLHSGRSRNDQVATDLKLHVRQACADAVRGLVGLVRELVARAQTDGHLVLPSYTHRQRAQPVSLAFWLANYGAAFLRDAQAFAFSLEQADASPLGSGAISGSSLPLDRELTRTLLGFRQPTLNAMDTVGDRDFALDYLYATSRFFIHASRLATDLIDFTTAEFGFATLSGDISMGSSMMPQKKNPDVFELLRGKAGTAVGRLVGLLVTVKGLPGGYNRDLQEDRGPLLETAPQLLEALSVLRLALPRVTFKPHEMLAAVEPGFTQATDVAEVLVVRGMPFRVAYQVVGRLVRFAQEHKLTLREVTVAQAQAIDAGLTAEVLSVLAPANAVARKVSAGSTGPESVKSQLAVLESRCAALAAQADAVPTLSQLFSRLEGGAL